MVTLDSIVKDYGKKKTYRALKGISLSFPSIQFVSILGPSGCGKTTLLNLLGGLDSITSGDIRIDGRSLREMDDGERNRYRNEKIGFIFQDYFLIPQLKVLDNVRIALQVRGVPDSESREKALAMLRDVGIEDLADKKPNELSGGQTQRAAIARALITDPEIILADEPTGALDSDNSEAVMALLKEQSKKRLVILVTHNEELARRYSDRIVRIKDGRVVSDENIHDQEREEGERTLVKKSRLPFLTAIKIAFKNLAEKKWKTFLTCIANSFGMIGIGFFLSLNTGFSTYASQVSRVTASSLPIILTSYSTVTDSESFADVNSSVLYPKDEEIYPTVSTSSTTAYVYNNFTNKYFSFLDSLIEEGLVSEYVVNYGNSYSLNLTTTYPASLDGQKDSYVGGVNTTMTSYNSIGSSTGLPTSVFHVLYGGLSDYDCIAGRKPEKDDEIILVVDKYNSVSFSILKNIGFYNSSDGENDVKDPESDTKVKPISFTDILGKKYKVFSNEDYFYKTGEQELEDAFGLQKTVSRYATKNVSELFEDEKAGEELEIVGIYRPKKDSDYGLLSPALCFLPDLQESIVDANYSCQMGKDMRGNVVFSPGGDISTFNALVDELETALADYLNGETTVLPSSNVNSILNRYFYYYDYRSGNQTSLSSLVSQAGTLGIQVLPESMAGLSLSDPDSATALVDQAKAYLAQGDTQAIYDLVIGLSAYVNAYSLIDYVTILPASLSLRNEILDRLDSFNVIEAGSNDHASSASEQVFYSSANDSYAVSQVSQVIDMASLVLLVFAAISLTVSCAMTAILTTNNVLERRKEIGLLRSLGARKTDILGLFEIEAVFIGFLTGLVGSLATYLLTYPVNALISFYYPSYGVEHLAQFVFPHVFVLVAIGLVVGFLSALIPSLNAARQDPVKCLRSD